MKIRTDFVTNSSSSSYVTVIALDRNNNVTESRFEQDELFSELNSEDYDLSSLFEATNTFLITSK